MLELHDSVFINNSYSTFSFFDLYSPSVLIRNCTFIDNYLQFFSVLNVYQSLYYPDREFILLNSSFINCISEGAGGVIYSLSESNLRIEGVVFINSSAPLGGVIYLEVGSILSLKRCWFYGCSATSGGCIYVSALSSLLIEECIFEGSSAISSNGGALFLEQSSNLTLNSTIFRDCTAEYSGGAIFAENANVIISWNSSFLNCSSKWQGGAIILIKNANLAIQESIFLNSLSEYGGAIYMLYNSSINVERSTFLKNNAQQDGGSLFCKYGAFVEITACNFEENVALNGGVIMLDLESSLRFKFSVVIFERIEESMEGQYMLLYLKTYLCSTRRLLQMKQEKKAVKVPSAIIFLELEELYFLI
jgi:hypothetical protein